MPSKVDNMIIDNEKLDRRKKLTKNQKKEIYDLREKYSQRELARMYNVSRRTISFITDPEKIKKHMDARQKRGGSKRYYDKSKHREYMRSHRQYKEELNEKGLIK